MFVDRWMITVRCPPLLVYPKCSLWKKSKLYMSFFLHLALCSCYSKKTIHWDPYSLYLCNTMINGLHLVSDAFGLD